LSKDKKYANINALCLACKESLNRVRIREQGGLIILLDLLNDEDLEMIHNRLVGSLLCFLYDEPSIQILLSNNVITILTNHLSKCMGQKKQTLTYSSFNTAVDKLIDIVSKETDSSDAPEADNVIMTDGLIVEYEAIDTTDGLPLDMLDPEKSQSKSLTLPTGDGIDKSDEPSQITSHKYSMDSPTYKEISESALEITYDAGGPRNISECYDYGTTSSTGQWSPASYIGSPLRCPSPGTSSYSPLSNASTYVSPTWSLQSSSLGDQSLDWDRELSPLSCEDASPASSPTKPGGLLHMSYSWPGEFSPTTAVQYASPDKQSSPAHPSLLSVAECGQHNISHSAIVPQYSSSEEEDKQSEGETLIEDSQLPTKHHLPEEHKTITVGNILIFFSRVSFMDNASKYLSKWHVLNGLLELVAATHAKEDNRKRAYRILVRIFRMSCLEAIVSSAVPMILTLMTNLSTASSTPKTSAGNKALRGDRLLESGASIKLLEVLAEEIQSQYGGGVVAHCLMTGTMTQRLNAYLSLPMLYRLVTQGGNFFFFLVRRLFKKY
jgi:hypothetical protein